MHSSKVTIKDIPHKAAYAKIFEDRCNKEALLAAQEIVDRFDMYLKYRTTQNSYFLYQLRVNDGSMPAKVNGLVREALEPLGWQVSYTWNSTTLTYEFSIK